MGIYNNGSGIFLFDATPRRNLFPKESLTARSINGDLGVDCFIAQIALPENEPMKPLADLSQGYCIGIRSNRRDPEVLQLTMQKTADALRGNKKIAVLKSTGSPFYFIIGDLNSLSALAKTGSKKVPPLLTALDSPEVNIFADINRAIANLLNLNYGLYDNAEKYSPSSRRWYRPRSSFRSRKGHHVAK